MLLSLLSFSGSQHCLPGFVAVDDVHILLYIQAVESLGLVQDPQQMLCGIFKQSPLLGSAAAFHVVATVIHGKPDQAVMVLPMPGDQRIKHTECPCIGSQLRQRLRS